jgi:PHD/YefM family antitoxin component YafN of YafNO toxin-antitoxin module
MPMIRPSADLRNRYNEISELCHTSHEPVFITKNGQGDLAVMSMETFDLFYGRSELYSLLDAGLEQDRLGETVPLNEAMSEIREALRKK